MKFSETVGQDSVIKKLTYSVNNGRISHAQLFYAKEGAGALALAMSYIQFINCGSRTETDSCGTCNSCKKIENLSHPDLHFSFPIISSTKTPDSDSYLVEWKELWKENKHINFNSWKEKIGADKKQLLIPVKEADRISKKLSLKSYEGGYKFMVIYLAEYMKAPCANKLLKLLEEPPEKTLIILISNDFENIISTILSRTQLVKLNIPKDEEISSYLENKLGLTSEKAASVSKLADGNLAHAISMAGSENSDSNQLTLFSELMRFAYKKDIAGAIDWANKLHTMGREDLKLFISYSLHMVRQCIIGNYAGHEMRKLNTQENQFAERFAPYINEKNVIQVYEHLSSAERDISRNGYAKIILLDTAINLFRCINPRK